MDGIGSDLCAGLFYEHRSAVLIIQAIWKSKEVPFNLLDFSIVFMIYTLVKMVGLATVCFTVDRGICCLQ